jgi:hypothetical protein
VAFVLIALVDLVLVWFPARLEDGRWAFDTVNAVLGSMPLLAVGLVLGYAAAIARGRRAALRLWSALMILVAAALLAAFGLFLLRIPDALGAAESPEVRSGLTKAAARTGLQAVLYPAVLLWLGIKGLQDPPNH